MALGSRGGARVHTCRYSEAGFEGNLDLPPFHAGFESWGRATVDGGIPGLFEKMGVPASANHHPFYRRCFDEWGIHWGPVVKRLQTRSVKLTVSGGWRGHDPSEGRPQGLGVSAGCRHIEHVRRMGFMGSFIP